MSTMDIVKLHGGEPANFLDVGGSASEEAVTEAFRIILSDARVNGVLVNIFGGIMQCDRIARAIIASAKTVGFKVPLVVRLEGTNAELGKQIINESGLDVIAANDLSDGAEKIVKAVRGAA
jgi:succinyl-CoA synthetase beta subunit